MSNYEKIANETRLKVLDLIYENKTSHIGSNFSVIDLAVVLYANKKPEDVVIWSAGWKAATACVLEGKEFVPMLETGSMGHGLPMGVGQALAMKRTGEKGNVYVIMSDGEMDCGTTWESAKLAGEFELDNLYVLIDANGWQAMKRTSNHRLLDKWRAFNWFAKEIEPEVIERAICNFHRPRAFIFRTTKGQGVSFMSDNNLYHYKQLTKDEYDRAKAELA